LTNRPNIDCTIIPQRDIVSAREDKIIDQENGNAAEGQRAKQVDPSLAGEMDKKIATYSVYFPAASTIFFYAMKEGDTYRVECWINEDTKIRASKQ